MFFPTLAVGLLDLKVDVVLARLEADFSDQPPSIPAVPNHQVPLQCPTAKYPCTAQPPSIPAVPNHQISLQCPTIKSPCSAQPPSIPAVPNHQVSLQGPTTKYPCSAQPSSIPAVPNHQVSLQCPTAKYPGSAQPPNIPAVSNHQISLQRPTEKYPCSAQAQSIPGVPNSKVSIFLQRICSAARKTVEGGGKETLHFLCKNGFRVGMLEVFFCSRQARWNSKLQFWHPLKALFAALAFSQSADVYPSQLLALGSRV